MKKRYIPFYMFSETELTFYRKYKLFPDDIITWLFRSGYSRESIQPIQKEMDKIFLEAKTLADFTPVECDPFSDRYEAAT